MTAIRNLMVEDLVTVEAGDTVLEAASRMKQNRVGAVLVVDRGELVGLFSERDLLERIVVAKRDFRTTRVGDVASRNLVTVDIDDPLKNVLDGFRAGRFRHLPVLEKGKAVGILSTRDFLSFLVDGLERYIEEIRYRRDLAEGVDPYDHLGGSYSR